MVSDFAAPKWGGVETHTFQLGQSLIERGHKVIFISCMYKWVREGVRYIGNGMKVYHLPYVPVINGDVTLIMMWF